MVWINPIQIIIKKDISDVATHQSDRDFGMETLPVKLHTMHAISEELLVLCILGRWPLVMFSYFESSKRSDKCHLRLWCEQNLPMQLQHNASNSWGVIMPTRQSGLGLAWKFKQVRQCQCRTHTEHPCKVTIWCMQLLRSYFIHKSIWPWVRLKIQKGHTNVNIELVRDFDVKNILISIEQIAGN